MYVCAHLSLIYLYIYICIFAHVCACGEQKRPGGTELICPSLFCAFYSVGYWKSSKPQLIG